MVVCENFVSMYKQAQRVWSTTWFFLFWNCNYKLEMMKIVVWLTPASICGGTVDKVLKGFVERLAVDALSLGRPDVLDERLHHRDVLWDGPGELRAVTVGLLTHGGLSLTVKGYDTDLWAKRTNIIDRTWRGGHRGRVNNNGCQELALIPPVWITSTNRHAHFIPWPFQHSIRFLDLSNIQR